MKNKKSLSILRAHFVFQRDYHIDPTFIYLFESRATLCHDAQPASSKCKLNFHLLGSALNPVETSLNCTEQVPAGSKSSHRVL